MNLFAVTDDLLRHGSRAGSGDRAGPQVALLVGAGFLYGLVLGGHELRPLQMLYSGIKVPILLTVSSLICLPNFFVVNTLLGLREDFPVVLRGLLGTQATMAVTLFSLAPLTAIAYVSSGDYAFAVVCNGVMFLVASLCSQVYLGQVYAPLVAVRPRHRIGKASWLVLYVLVTIQLAWMLRPFVGSPGLATTFFREGVWDNAYVVVVQTVGRVLGIG